LTVKLSGRRSVGPCLADHVVMAGVRGRVRVFEAPMRPPWMTEAQAVKAFDAVARLEGKPPGLLFAALVAGEVARVAASRGSVPGEFTAPTAGVPAALTSVSSPTGGPQ
jgi:hypothetical protein